MSDRRPADGRGRRNDRDSRVIFIMDPHVEKDGFDDDAVLRESFFVFGKLNLNKVKEFHL